MHDIMKSGTFKFSERVNEDGSLMLPEEVRAFSHTHSLAPEIFIRAFNKYMNENDGEMPTLRLKPAKDSGIAVRWYREYYEIRMASTFGISQADLDELMPFHSLEAWNLSPQARIKAERQGTQRISSYCILLYLLRDELDLDGFQTSIAGIYKNADTDHIVAVTKLMGDHHRFIWSQFDNAAQIPYFKTDIRSHLEVEAFNISIENGGIKNRRKHEVAPLLWKTRTFARYNRLLSDGVNPQIAAYWANGGYSEIDSRYLERIESGELHCSTAILWADNGFDGDYASNWIKEGFTVEQANDWYAKGVLHPDEAKKMAELAPSTWIGAW